MSDAPILTARLRLRPLELDDWPAVHAFASDPTTMAFMPEGVMDDAQTRQFIAEHCSDESRYYAAELLAEDRLIGYLPFHPWYSARIYEIGWVLHPDYQGKGYATEAAAALLAHGFTTLGLHRVIATCQPQNPASWRIMEKLGMRREGHLRQCIERPDGIWWDEYFYAILAEEWFGNHNARQ